MFDRNLSKRSIVYLIRIIISVTWIVAVVCGMSVLGKDAARPSDNAAISDWPAISTLSRIIGEPTVVVCLHPQCPCSHATLQELARALSPSISHGPVYALFSIPANENDWETASLIDFAREIPGVTVVRDRDGIECDRFGARASGQTFVFDAQGKLLFNGGLTPSRGHEGDTPGRDIVQQALFSDLPMPQPLQTPVFGCALCRPNSAQGAR